MFFLKASCRHVVVVVTLNDVVILRLSGSELSESGDHVGQWIDVGDNRLRLHVLGPSPHESSVVPPGQLPPPSPLGNARVTAELVKLPRDHRGPAEGQPIARVDWSFDAAQPAFPAVRERRFAGEPVPGQRWRASRLPMDLATGRASLLAWLHALQASIARGDGAAVVAACRPGLLDLADACGLDGAEQVASFADLFRRNSPVVDLEPIVDRDLALDVMGGGKLIDVVRRDGRPAITARADAATPFEFAVRAGMIEGAWRVF